MTRWVVMIALIGVAWFAVRGATGVQAAASRPERPEIEGGFTSGSAPVSRPPDADAGARARRGAGPHGHRL